jgi:site-specific DNA-methyltransferase (adenine-specific)
MSQILPGPPPSGIIPGDCVQGMADHLPDGSVQLAFADPPFNIGYGYDVYDDRKSCDDYLDWSRLWMAQVRRVLAPDGAFWLAIGDEYVAELKVIAHRDLGFHLRSWVVWYYTFGVHCTHKFTRSHAHLLYFVKDPKRFTFNVEDIRVPSARQLIYADKRSNPRGRTPDDTWLLRPQQIPDGFAPESDTWYVPRVCGTYKERAGWHGCQMPEQILGRIVRACSNPGDLVIDPFSGSGTTLTVARKLGRRYVGFELSDEYRAQATKRLEACNPGDPLEGAEPPPVTGTRPRPRKRVAATPRPAGEILFGTGPDL